MFLVYLLIIKIGWLKETIWNHHRILIRIMKIAHDEIVVISVLNK